MLLFFVGVKNVEDIESPFLGGSTRILVGLAIEVDRLNSGVSAKSSLSVMNWSILSWVPLDYK